MSKASGDSCPHAPVLGGSGGPAAGRGAGDAQWYSPRPLVQGI